MNWRPATTEPFLPTDLAAELERRFFWWEPVAGPRSHARILAQAMNFASGEDVHRLETAVGMARLAEMMMTAQAGWFSERSWKLWRERLASAKVEIPAAPPRRAFEE